MTEEEGDIELFPISRHQRQNTQQGSNTSSSSDRTSEVDNDGHQYDLFPRRGTGGGGVRRGTVTSSSDLSENKISYEYDDDGSEDKASAGTGIGFSKEPVVGGVRVRRVQTKLRHDSDPHFNHDHDHDSDNDTDDIELNSIDSSILPESVHSSTIRDVLTDVPDKAKLRDEINGFKDRRYFINLFAPKLNFELIGNSTTTSTTEKNNHHDEDEFLAYDREVKLESYLRSKTKNYIMNRYTQSQHTTNAGHGGDISLRETPITSSNRKFSSSSNNNHRIDIKQGELSDDDVFIAGQEFSHQDNNIKGKGKFINKTLPLNRIQNLFSSKQGHQQQQQKRQQVQESSSGSDTTVPSLQLQHYYHRADRTSDSNIDLQNLKSAETNAIDTDFNNLYNIPIDHQNYNNLVNTHAKRMTAFEKQLGNGTGTAAPPDATTAGGANNTTSASGMFNNNNNYHNRTFRDSQDSSYVGLEALSSFESGGIAGTENTSWHHHHRHQQQQQEQQQQKRGKRWWLNGGSKGTGTGNNHFAVHYEIHHKLKTRHLTMIAFGGTLGVGLFLASGKAFSIAGPLGTLLGFTIAGSTVLATMLSFCEMVTLIPLAGGVSGISSRFVEDAFGFALGISYWFNYMIGLPTEITAATIMLSYYDTLQIPGVSTAGFVTMFLVIIIAINLCDIRVYGEIEYFSSLLKLFFLLALIIFNIVLNRGGVAPYHEHIGFKYWDSSKSNLTEAITYGPFRPTFDVNDIGLGATDGIGGAKGRFLAVLIASVVAAYCFIGTEIALIAGGEAKSPRKAIPKSSKAIYWRILLFYIVGIFVISLNIYSGDPRLLRYYESNATVTADEDTLRETIIEANGGTTCEGKLLEWAGFANGNQSPWVIALQSAGLCNFAAVLNAFLVYFAVTAGSSQLYAASRTCYYMSIQGKLPKFFSKCSKYGVPYIAVLFTGSVGSLAYLTVNNDTATVFQKFLSICSSFGLVVWGGMNLSFIRFYYGLKLRPDIIGRDDPTYPYRSPLQPYLAYYGLCSSLIMVLVNGLIVFLKGNWSVSTFFTSYGSPILMVICYVAYKISRRTKIHRLDQLDLDSGRREIDRIIWEDNNRSYNLTFKELLKRGINFMA